MEEIDDPNGYPSAYKPEMKTLEKITVDLYNTRLFLGILLGVFSIFTEKVNYEGVWISLISLFMGIVELRIHRLIIKF